MKIAQCCFIPDQTHKEKRCTNNTTFEIWYGENPTPDDYSHSCDEHLVEMLDDSKHFEINRL